MPQEDSAGAALKMQRGAEGTVAEEQQMTALGDAQIAQKQAAKDALTKRRASEAEAAAKAAAEAAAKAAAEEAAKEQRLADAEQLKAVQDGDEGKEEDEKADASARKVQQEAKSLYLDAKDSSTSPAPAATSPDAKGKPPIAAPLLPPTPPAGQGAL